jgi:hypothetical protein
MGSAMAVDHVARIRSALMNTSPPRLAAGDALRSLEALQERDAARDEFLAFTLNYYGNRLPDSWKERASRLLGGAAVVEE